MRTMLKNKKGFILIMSYLLLAVLSVVSLGIFNWGNAYIRSSERNRKKIIAFNMADGGFDYAYALIKNNSVTSYPYTISYTSMNWTSTGGMQGGFDGTVTDMGSGIKKISITGYSPSQSSTTESVESRAVVGYVQTANASAFGFGVFAKSSIQMSGNAQIDAYNSNNGAYGGSNAYSKGNMATDTAAAGMVMLSGNVMVKGNMTTGVNSNPDSVITTSGNVVITGTKAAAATAQNPPTLNSSGATSGTLTISGNTNYTLAAGTYKFTSISISGNGKLTATGPVVIYVTGSVSIAGNGIGTSDSKPPNMLIYVSGTSNVALSGNANLYAGLYAPNSNVKNTGNGQLFGAIVSKSYAQSGNGNVHFDEALKNVQGGNSSTSVLSWQEQGLTNQG